MARITVDDCRKVAPNPFELVLFAAERARSLKVGAAPLVEAGRDAPPVLALREIAAGRLSPTELRQIALLRRRARVAVADEAARGFLPGRLPPGVGDEPDFATVEAAAFGGFPAAALANAAAGL